MNFVEAYNVIDLFILGTLLITIVLGFWKGFVRTLSAVTGLILGVVGAARYYPLVEPYLSRISSLDPQICSILSMVLIFIGVQVVFVLIRRILDALIDLTRLSWVDRVLGAAMGAASGLLVVAAVVQAVLIAMPEWPAVGTSRLVRPVDGLTGKALNYAPEQIRNQLQSLIAKWKGPQESYPQAPQHRTAAPGKEPLDPTGRIRE